MYTINIYKNYDQLEMIIKDVQEENLDHVFKNIEEAISIHGKEWYKEGLGTIEFRIEVIDRINKDIRNIIWESKKGFLEVCSIEKYIRYLINKETYQIWIKDYADDDEEGICKFAD